MSQTRGQRKRQRLSSTFASNDQCLARNMKEMLPSDGVWCAYTTMLVIRAKIHLIQPPRLKLHSFPALTPLFLPVKTSPKPLPIPTSTCTTNRSFSASNQPNSAAPSARPCSSDGHIPNHVFFGREVLSRYVPRRLCTFGHAHPVDVQKQPAGGK